MVRNYKRKTENARWSENDLQAAIKDIKDKTITFLKATELYKIPRSIIGLHCFNTYAIKCPIQVQRILVTLNLP